MNRNEMIERTARIICENKLADCLCKGPSHYVCTNYSKARNIVNMLVPEGSVVLANKYTKQLTSALVI